VLGGPESIVAMANGSIDALVIVEPFFSQVEQNAVGAASWELSTSPRTSLVACCSCPRSCALKTQPPRSASSSRGCAACATTWTHS
jgi:hypothetical protein